MAEITLNCPKCNGLITVCVDSEVETFVCEHCGETSPLVAEIDDLGVVAKDPLVGSVISEWEIQEKVGEGGFGAVYKAFDRNLQRPVAIKVMLQSLTSQSRTPRGGTDQEPPGATITGLPDQITDPLETEHRIEGIKGYGLDTVVGVSGSCCYKAGH